MCDDDGIDKQKKPRLFIEWPESGEPAVLYAENIADLDNLPAALDSFKELLTGDYEDGEQIVVYRKLMTDEEVAALPEL